MTKKKHTILYVFLLSLLFKPLWIFETQILTPSDDFSYWLHSTTVAFDYDITYIDDHNYDHYTFHPLTKAPLHPPGAGYANAPFVFIFNQIDNIKKNNVDRLNPSGSFAFIGYFAGTLLYCYLGFYFLMQIINKKKYNHYGLLYIVILLSSLIHFVAGRFLMAHSFEFFLCSALLYLFETKKNLFQQVDFLKLTIVYFFLSITRPSTFIYSICLLGIYYDSFKFKINIKQLITNFSVAFIFISIYIHLSNKLYNENTILIDVSKSIFLNEQADLFNLTHSLNGLKNFPNLIFSTSMGIIWIMPTVVFLLFNIIKPNYFFGKFNKTKYLFFLLYILGCFAVLFIWQGIEISYGQRLLIGLLPISFISISKVKIINYKILNIYFYLLYIAYLYFYSPNLSLAKGKTLWGTVVEFAPTEYFSNLFFSILNLENILYVLLKNIYTVNIVKSFSLENLNIFNNLIEKLSFDNQIKLLEIFRLYNGIDIFYLLVTNFCIFTFSYLFVNKIMIKK